MVGMIRSFYSAAQIVGGVTLAIVSDRKVLSESSSFSLLLWSSSNLHFYLLLLSLRARFEWQQIQNSESRRQHIARTAQRLPPIQGDMRLCSAGT